MNLIYYFGVILCSGFEISAIERVRLTAVSYSPYIEVLHQELINKGMRNPMQKFLLRLLKLSPIDSRTQFLKNGIHTFFTENKKYLQRPHQNGLNGMRAIGV